MSFRNVVRLCKLWKNWVRRSQGLCYVFQEQLRETDFRFAELMRKQQQQHQDEMMMRKHKELMSQQEEFLKKQRYQKQYADMKPDIKPDMSKDVKPSMYPGYPGKQEHLVNSVPAGVKQEVGTASFSLYGYQPDKYSYISADQLHLYEQDKIKGEKGMIDPTKLGRPQSPRKKDIGPPPLIKDVDSKSHSSVIVKNNRDGLMKSSSPHGSHYASHMSPHQQPKPAHTPERPHSSNSSPGAARGMSPAMAHQQQMAAMRGDPHHAVTRSQSPLPIATPQQLSAAVMQPMDYQWCGPNVNKSRGSPGSSTSPHGSSGSPKIAQPSMSLPHSTVTYTYGLIQQGLAPNPIYSHNSKNPDSQRTVSVTGTAQVPRAAQSPPNYSQQMQQQSAIGTKRKGQKETNNRKRQKGNEPQSTGSNSPLNLSVPCTTPQIVTNQSPYTTSSVTVPSTATCTTQSSTPTSLAFSQAVVNNRLASFTGFMDSFKSFVENTVQNAFMSDPDLSKVNKDGQMKKPTPEQLKELQQQHIQQQMAMKTQPYKPKTSLERSCTPVAISQQNPSQPADEATNLSNSGSNSAISYVDSINRVANGQIDTDSDTLSAPSPPPHLKQENNNNPSPHKTAKHPNLKKAWLQRHSDEDKQECKPSAPSPAVPVTSTSVVTDSANAALNPNGAATAPSEQDKEVKTCFVNCSYISPSSAGGSKSPISAITNVVPNGTAEKENDESTTSASETETQVSTLLLKQLLLFDLLN